MSTQTQEENDSEQSMETQSSTTMMTVMTPQPAVAVRPKQECRTNTKLVAYINIVVNILHIMFLAVMIILLAYPIPDLKGHLQTTFQQYIPEGQEIPESFDWIIEWIKIALIVCIVILLVLIGFVLLELFIAWGLLKSTRVGTSPGQAIKKAKCWLCCHICLVILNILGMGAFFIMPSERIDEAIKEHLKGVLPSSSSSGSNESSEESAFKDELLANATAQIKSYGEQADGYTIGFDGFNIVLFVIRLLFMFIVHSFIRQLRSIGYSM